MNSVGNETSNAARADEVGADAARGQSRGSSHPVTHNQGGRRKVRSATGLAQLAEPAGHDTEDWVRTLRTQQLEPVPDISEGAGSAAVPEFGRPSAVAGNVVAPGRAAVPGSMESGTTLVPRGSAEYSGGTGSFEGELHPVADAAGSPRDTNRPHAPEGHTEQSTVSGGASRAWHEAEAMRAHERMLSRMRRARVCAGLVEWTGSLLAIVLVVHTVLTVADANPANVIARVMGTIAPPLTVGFTDLFRPDDPALGLVLNHGSAAIFWLLLGSLLGRLVRKVWV